MKNKFETQGNASVNPDDERERKKQVKREWRLRAVIEKLTELLRACYPEESSEFEITFGQVSERTDHMLGDTVEIPESQSPAFGVFLTLRADPNAKFEIMHLFRQDIDAAKLNFDTLVLSQLPAFEDRLREGYIELKKSQTK